MFKNFALTITAIAAVQVSTLAFAQDAPPLPNPHQTYDQNLRICRAEASASSLQAEARRAAIASCLQKRGATPAPLGKS